MLLLQCIMSDIGALLSGVGTMLGAGAVIYAAHKGVNTFDIWKRQKTEERRIELAEQILTLAYHTKEAFEMIRHPGMGGSESKRVEESLVSANLIPEADTKHPPSGLVTAQAALLRITKKGELWDKLDAIIPSAKAVFGEIVSDALEVFIKERSRIMAAAHGLASLTVQQMEFSDIVGERYFERSDRYQKILWSGLDGEGKDSISNSITVAIDNLENALLPTIRAGYEIKHP